MELRQLRAFVRVVEVGSISRAAIDLNVVQSALSQQITKLESELSTRLLQRSPQGVTPTEAGVAFFREAQLTLRHAEQAIRAAQESRLSGTVSVGMAPTTAAVLGMPLMRALRERYPDVRLHMVESLSGHLTSMLNARQLDLAVLFDSHLLPSPDLKTARRWSVMPLLEEDLFFYQCQEKHQFQDGQLPQTESIEARTAHFANGAAWLANHTRCRLCKDQAGAQHRSRNRFLGLAHGCCGCRLGCHFATLGCCGQIPGCCRKVSHGPHIRSQCPARQCALQFV